jgi:6-phosphogluconolactonase
MADVRVQADADTLFDAAAAFVTAQAVASLAARPRFVLALAGGSTPRGLYQRLAHRPWHDRIDWPRVHVFWGDERCVPPTDPASNYRMAREALLDHVPVPPAQVHRMHGEQVPDQAALSYEAELRATLDSPAHDVPAPHDAGRLDLVLLGLGSDGHTASLFPGGMAGRELTRWVLAEHVDDERGWRITLTPPALHAARAILFLVTGSDKAEALAAVLEGPARPSALPAQRVATGSRHVTWLVDQAAARLLAQPHHD